MRRRDARPPFWFLRRRPPEIRREIQEEIDTHLAMRIDALVASGLSEDEARREALRQFGDRARTVRYCAQEDLVKATGIAWTLGWGDVLHDARLCVRSLLRARTLTATIVLTVGLGIGLTTAMFAAVYGVLVRPLPYRDSGRLFRIYTDAPPYRFNFSVADYLTLDREQTQFARVAGYMERNVVFSTAASGELLPARVVTWTYFDLLGIHPAIGRDFTAGDARVDNPAVAIVDYRFWRDRLGARPDAIGSPIRIDGADYILVGVLPPLHGPLEQRPGVYLAARWTDPPRKGPFFIKALGRLRDDATVASATTELRLINKRMFPVWRASYQDDRASWGLDDLKSDLVGSTRTMAGVAIAAVGLLWLIACANGSGLLLARAASRRRELAVRAALGASRARLARLLAAEGALLALAAATVGLAVASAGIQLLHDLGPAYFPRAAEIALDGPALAVFAALTSASACLCGLVPAFQSSVGRLDRSLRISSRSATEGGRTRFWRRLLVGLQFAIATPLLIVAALLLVSLFQLQRVDVGFDAHNLFTAAVRLPAAQYGDDGRVAAVWQDLETRVSALPGVTSFAFADGRPPNGVDNFNNFDLEKFPAGPGRAQAVTPWVAVTPSYFSTLGLSLVDGRLLDDRDARPGSPDVIVVDAAWARRFFPGESVVGQRLKSGGCTTCDWTTVVGVVTPVKYAGLDKPDDGTVYTPLTGGTSRYVVLRTSVPPATMVGSLRSELRALDPSLALSSPATIEDLVAESLDVPRSLSWLIGALAGAALLLATIGIYGVMSHYVQEHSREMSIRLALGGTPVNVVRHVLRHGMAVVTAGIAAGLVAAAIGGRYAASLLFGVRATDPLPFAAVGAALAGIALIASAWPSQRAVRADPAAVLRSE